MILSKPLAPSPTAKEQNLAIQQASDQGLYDSRYEHDACGVGFIANIQGQRSHQVIQQGLMILQNLDHRGAVGSDPLMGDGAGILIQIPDELYRPAMAVEGLTLPPPGEYGVGMIFLPKEEASRQACEQEIERTVRAEGQQVLGWRDVPVDHAMPMSPVVKEKEPVIRQIFIGRGPDIMVTDALERKLYVIRKSSAHAILALNLVHGKEYFVPSMSARTVVYKGLLLADQVQTYYRDLQDPRCTSAMALVHQRFSTNTFPTWPLAHPYRMVAHNGEINTVRGNFNWMRAREGVMSSPVLGDDLKKLFPLIYEGQSDTACFDNVLELLVMSGYSVAQAMMMMIPEAWENHILMDSSRRAFYEYHAAMMEPWDGPAAIAFTDGRQIGGTLDRNGLRPARYIETQDGFVIMASEAGVLPIPESNIVRKWRLQPGKMFLIDLEAGRIIDDKELKDAFAQAKPYKAWIDSVRIRLDDLPLSSQLTYNPPSLDLQQAFAYTQEDLHFIIQPMLTSGEEAIGSMGNDAALAVLSDKNKPLYAYFRQMFAQVTNPPIDPIRESLVMSLVSVVGPRPNLLDTNNVNPPMRLEVTQPILGPADMAKIHTIATHTRGKFKSRTLGICYPVEWGHQGMEARLASLLAQAVDAVKTGHNILVLSDKAISKTQVAIPALLAVSAVHQHLVQKGLRTSTGLVVETGSAREVHHFALLAGYGAEAIHPWLAMETVISLAGKIAEPLPQDKAIATYQKAIGKGLLKVLSKMGISTYMSYCGAQIFEAIGLDQSFVDRYFRGTASRIGGVGLSEIAEEAVRAHQSAYGSDPLLQNNLDPGGEYAYRVRGEAHLWTPEAIAHLQHAVRSNQFSTYQEYARLINDQSVRHLTLRGLLKWNVDPSKSIPIEEVEPAREIVKRFATGAMSLGSISTEAHTTLAVAMNRIGGKSNTGEGGEDPQRYRHEKSDQPMMLHPTLAGILGKKWVERDLPLKTGDSLRSRIKQVASGRFGVTAEYLSSADQIQIKMAQGAKPGEGGQLPGHKVSEYIARLRFSVPGVGLISPPPHHDIYSIEDLAQLIHDLKNVNPSASISVKLVAETGVGTVSAGVAKAKADHVVIAGHDGGTGASPVSSIKYAGIPWEIGLAETQQTLVLNRLRSRIRVQVDGQIKTGRDVVIGAILGADEFGFATAPLVASGCIMMRKCHLNTCPVGVATQDPVLRRRFNGQPEHVVNYFFFVAEEVRMIMATLGIRRFNDLIGHTELLSPRQDIGHWKAKNIDFSRLLYQPNLSSGTQETRYQTTEQNHGLDKALDRVLIKSSKAALENHEKTVLRVPIRNANRSVGAMLSGEVAKRYGNDGLPEDTLQVYFQGSAGQSFGAFLAQGITFYLKGETNDYVGKGLSGGRLVIYPPPEFAGPADRNILIGNTVLYGATAGEAYFNGVAGERFAVRNSGAVAVVEGTGDHGCEYMTGGTIVVLGATGRNFAAGMSGGVAYVYDPEQQFAKYCNTAMVEIQPVLSAGEQAKTSAATWHRLRVDRERETDAAILEHLLRQHYHYTRSNQARTLLDDWNTALRGFVKVMPHEYKRALTLLWQQEESLQKAA